MKEIEFPTPITIGEKTVTKARVAPLMFKKFADITREALNARGPKQKLEPLMLRARIRAQTTFLTASGDSIPVTQDALTTLPIVPSKLIVAALTFDEGTQGELLNAGDGISTPIHYKLGTPIKGANGKTISEIEFLAKQFSDVEDVLAADNALYQTVDLFEKVAKPVDGSMLALPSWAIDHITLADGTFVMNTILPRFLE